MLGLISNRNLHVKKIVFGARSLLVSSSLNLNVAAMKNNIFFLVFLIFLLQGTLFSQGWNLQSLNVPIPTPEGDDVIGQAQLTIPGISNAVTNMFYITKDGIFGKAPNGVLVQVAIPYTSEEIVSFYTYQNKLFLVAKDDYGNISLAIYVSESSNSVGFKKSVKLNKYNVQSSLSAAKGDAVYLTTSTLCYVTRDNFASVKVDTSGFNGAVVNSFDLDSSQTVYSATTKGLFKQSPSGTVWGKVASFPLQGSLNKIFIDRSQRIYVSAGGNVYYSTDKGNTWTANFSGLNYSSVTGFGEDSYKNIYVLVGNQVFKSAGGTNPWVRIDKPVSDLFLDADPNGATSPFNCVGGDSTLYLSTHYGLFKSKDQGVTWTAMVKGISAKNIYGFAKSGTRTFVSTNLGLFYKDQNSSQWTKTFPSGGYTNGNVIFADQSGNIYALGAHVVVSNYYSPSVVWKSTDNGNTWKADTTGFGSFLNSGTPQYFVDENHVQHLMLINSSVVMYKKSPADSKWIADTSGLGKGFSSYPSVIASDNHGFLYAAFVDYSKNPATGILFKRPIVGGSWVADTIGLHSHQVWNVSIDGNGNMILGTIDNGVYKKVGNNWNAISSPPGLSGKAAFATAVDKYGTIYAGFSDYNWNNFNYVWHGVYKTANGGTSWVLAGLDSIAVRNLVIVGDTLYAVTYYKGIFKMPIVNPTDVRIAGNSIPSTLQLQQNYPNPFNPETVISYQLPFTTYVKLKVFDILGREVQTLVDGEETGGNYNVKFDAGSFASGVYFYKIEAGNFVQTRKMILIK